MNFFEHQAQAKKKTARLVFYFLLAIIFIIILVDAIILGALLLTGDAALISSLTGSEVPSISHGYDYPRELIITPTLIINMAISIGLMVSPVVLAIIVLGSLFRLSQLSEGGVSVANLSGAVPIEPDTQDPLEKRFMNVVEEMSIASGVPIPKLYVMKEENSINAFVAGIKPEDTVMVVTIGALNALTRDELQGVVGHEFSHIFNSDMKISVRLIGILAGILLLGQLGGFLLRSLMYGRISRSRNKDDKSIFVILALGIGLVLVGYIGLFFGRLIKAAISRQRELLADASSLQYTREPTGLINALRRIEASSEGSLLKTKHAEDISHLCFSPSMSVFFSTLLATHPKIEERIKALDNDGLYAQQPLAVPSSSKKSEKSEKPVNNNMSDNEKLMAGMGVIIAGAMQTQSQDIKNSIGKLSQSHILLAQTLISDIPSDLLDIAHDINKIDTLLYALLFPKSEESKIKATTILQETLNPNIIIEIASINEQVQNLNTTQILPLLDIALPSFKANDLSKRQTIFQNLEKLASCQPNDLFPFTLLALVGKMVEDKKTSNTVYNSFDPVISDLCVLIATVLHFSHSNPIDADTFYSTIMNKLTTKNIPQPVVNSFQGVHLNLVLKRLNQLSFPCKEKLIQACLECIEADGKINVDEAQIVRAIASCLDCPIPLIVPTE